LQQESPAPIPESTQGIQMQKPLLSLCLLLLSSLPLQANAYIHQAAFWINPPSGNGFNSYAFPCIHLDEHVPFSAFPQWANSPYTKWDWMQAQNNGTIQGYGVGTTVWDGSTTDSITNRAQYLGKTLAPKDRIDSHRASYPWVDQHFKFSGPIHIDGFPYYEVYLSDFNKVNFTMRGASLIPYGNGGVENTRNIKESAVGDPILAGSGKQTVEIPLINLPGEVPQIFTVTFTNQRATDATFPTSKILVGGGNQDSVLVVDHSGAKWYFSREDPSDPNNQSYLPTTGFAHYVNGKLERHKDTQGVTTGYTLHLPHGKKWNYDVNGKATSMEDKGRLTYIVSYYPVYGFRDAATYYSVIYDRRTGQVKDHTGTRIADVTSNGYSGHTPADRYTSFLPIWVQAPNGGWFTETVQPASGPALYKNISIDDQNRLTEQEDGNGDSIILSYNFDTLNGTTVQKTEVTDYEGETWLHWYNPLMQLLKKESPLGHIKTFHYDTTSTLLTSQVDPNGNTTSFLYSPFGTISQVTDPAGEIWQYQWDDEVNLASTTDPLGNTWSYDWDLTTHTLTEKEDPLGNIWQYQYNAFKQLTQTTYPNLSTRILTYTGGKPTTIQERDATLWQLQYFPTGFLKKTTDPQGYETEFEVDGMGRVTKTITDSGYEWTTTYDWQGRATSITDPDGETTIFTYDGNGRLIETTDRLGKTTIFTRDGNGNITTTEDPTGRYLYNIFDVDGRLNKVSSGTLGWTEFTLDPNGNTTQISEPGFGVLWQGTYNSRNLLLTESDALTNTFTYTYDERGLLKTTTDPNLDVTSYQYDGKENLLQTTFPIGQQSQTVDWERNITSQTNARSATTNYNFDVAGRLSGWTTPEGETWGITYNSRGLQETITNPRGEVTSLQYDPEGFLSSTTDPEGTITHTYSPQGWLMGISDSLQTLTYTRDKEGRLLSFTPTTGEAITYQRDDAGRTTQIEVAGKPVTYTYTPSGQLETVTDWANRTTTYQYDASGRLVKTLLPNGTEEELLYDTRGLLDQIRHQRTNAPPVFWEINFTRDSLGRIASQETTDHQGTHTQNFTYDAIGRLTQAAHSLHGTITYGYDLAGNITTFLDGAASPTLTYNNDDVLTAVDTTSTTFDANGNILQTPLAHGSPVTDLVYDSRDQLIEVLSSTGNDYIYDPLGQILSITDSSSNTDVFTYDPETGLPLHIQHSNGNETINIIGKGILYSVIFDSLGNEIDQKFYHFNLQGSTVATTDLTGTVTETADYKPYGEAYNSSLTDYFQYKGRWGVQTHSDGLLFMGSRFYSPYLKRFLTQDTIPGLTSLSGTLNLYAYCLGDPINRIDPFGTWSVFLDGVQIGLDVLGYTPIGIFADLINAGIYAARGDWGSAGISTFAAIPFVGDFGKGIYTAVKVSKRVNGTIRVTVKAGAEVAKKSYPTIKQAAVEATGNAKHYSELDKSFALSAPSRLPHGFGSADDFTAFGKNLNSGLGKAGFGDTQALFQGSSVTGKSFRTGQAFDVGRVSDFDIALAGDSIFSRAKALGIPLRSGGTRTGPLRAIDLKRLGLSDLSSQLGSQAGRPVNFMIYQDATSAATRAPSILVP